MTGERILIVEDELPIILIYETVLRQAGYRTMAVQDGKHAIAFVRDWQPHLIILDIIMPGLNGLEICRALRKMPGLQSVPLLMVTAHWHTADRVLGLEAGADDYLSKPFNIDELAARVRALLRRAQYHRVASIAEPGAIQINHHTMHASIGERSIGLTHMEYQLLNYLVHHEGLACSIEQLLRDVWGYSIDSAEAGLVRWHMTNLRTKIELNPKTPHYIHTIRSRGYIYKPGYAGIKQSSE